MEVGKPCEIRPGGWQGPGLQGLELICTGKADKRGNVGVTTSCCQRKMAHVCDRARMAS